MRHVCLVVPGVVALFSLLAVTGCKQPQDRTCAQENVTSKPEVASPWKELAVAEGDVCMADPKFLSFIVKRSGDPVAVAQRAEKKLVAQGWKAEPMPKPQVIKAGSDTVMAIHGWRFTHEGSAASPMFMSAEGFAKSLWKDEPVKVTLTYH